jgi:hypothetical protein
MQDGQEEARFISCSLCTKSVPERERMPRGYTYTYVMDAHGKEKRTHRREAAGRHVVTARFTSTQVPAHHGEVTQPLPPPPPPANG